MRFKACAVLCLLACFAIAAPLSLCAKDDPEFFI